MNVELSEEELSILKSAMVVISEINQQFKYNKQVTFRNNESKPITDEKIEKIMNLKNKIGKLSGI